MSSRTTILLLAVILSIATFLRVYQLASTPPGLYPDEAMNGNNALEGLRIGFPGGFKVFYPENNGREGLFINIQALFLWLAGALSEGGFGFISNNEPWILRLPSALFGVLTVLGVYFLAKELFKSQESWVMGHESGVDGKWSSVIGLLSAFFLATSFWHINFSRIGFRAIMAPFFLTWGLYFFLRSLKYLKPLPHLSFFNSQLNHGFEDKKKYWKLVIGNWTFPILSGLSIGLGMHSYIAYRVMPFVFLAFLPWHLRERKFWVMLSVTSLTALAVAAPLFFYYFQNPADFLGRTSQVSVFSAPHPLKDLGVNTLKTIGMLFFAGDSNWRHNIAGRPELFWPVRILFLAGTVMGLKSLMAATRSKLPTTNYQLPTKNKNSEKQNKIGTLPFVILFSWLLLAVLPVVISNEGIPHALRSILMLPPIMIFAGVGGVTIYDYLVHIAKTHFTQRERGIIVLRTGTMLFLSILFFESYVSYFFTWGQNPNVQGAFSANYVALGRTLNNLPVNIPKYVVVNASGVSVRGIPMPAQTVMFITDTFTPEGQREKNIYYTTPEKISDIPMESSVIYLNE